MGEGSVCALSRTRRRFSQFVVPFFLLWLRFRVCFFQQLVLCCFFFFFFFGSQRNGQRAEGKYESWYCFGVVFGTLFFFCFFFGLVVVVVAVFLLLLVGGGLRIWHCSRFEEEKPANAEMVGSYAAAELLSSTVPKEMPMIQITSTTTMRNRPQSCVCVCVCVCVCEAGGLLWPRGRHRTLKTLQDRE